jgi:hypothetical protein
VKNGYVGEEKVKIKQSATIRVTEWETNDANWVRPHTIDIYGDSKGLLTMGMKQLMDKKNITMTLTWEE